MKWQYVFLGIFIAEASLLLAIRYVVAYSYSVLYVDILQLKEIQIPVHWNLDGVTFLRCFSRNAFVCTEYGDKSQP